MVPNTSGFLSLVLFTQSEDCCEVDFNFNRNDFLCACCKGHSNYIVPLKHAFPDILCGEEVKYKANFQDVKCL